ncbi:MAG: acyl carrier protein [Armatimonadetes bacterium]|nr:acyl carrier protein [Armatimonadota bacterium]
MAVDAQLKQQLKDMIVERLFLNVAPADIPDAANLMDEYKIDSVNLFEIVVGLEEEFGLTLEDTDFSTETFSTVDNIAAFVDQKRS